MRPEAIVEDYFIRQAKKLGVWQSKFTSGITGVPDRIIVVNGVTAFVELKAKNGALSDRQKLVIATIRAHGGIVLIPFSKADVDDILANITKNRTVE